MATIDSEAKVASRNRAASSGAGRCRTARAEIDAAAAHGNDQHTGRRATSGRRVQPDLASLDHRIARDAAGKQGDSNAGDESAHRHRRAAKGRQSGNQSPRREDRVRNGIARQAHAAQHQEDADGVATEQKREATGERATHETELDERRNQREIGQRVDHRSSIGVADRRVREVALRLGKTSRRAGSLR